jgi:hypothetical protein
MMDVDFKGHCKGIQDHSWLWDSFQTRIKEHFDRYKQFEIDLEDVLAEQAAAIKEINQIRREGNLWSFDYGCGDCGKGIYFKKEGEKYYCSSEPCKYPDGYPVCKYELKVPSGSIIFGNDFRNLVDPKREGLDLHGDGRPGDHQYSKFYEKLGLIEVPTGNTCPGIFRYRDGFVIANSEQLKRKLGFICTDLWAFCAMDHDHFLSLKGKEMTYDTIVDVEPGIWSFTNEHNSFRDLPGQVIYSHIRFERSL